VRGIERNSRIHWADWVEWRYPGEVGSFVQGVPQCCGWPNANGAWPIRRGVGGYAKNPSTAGQEKMMKFSTRAGVLLVAFGAAAASMQSLASAVEPTPAQMVTEEAALEQATVPVNAPIGDVMRQAHAPVPGPSLSGALPAAPLLPPPPAQYRPNSLLPERLVQPLTVTRRTPGMGASVPLPGYGRWAEPGRFDLDAPASPLRTAGPALGLGDPLKFRPKALGDTHRGSLDWLEFGKFDPQLTTAPLSTVPGADAKLSPEDHPVRLPHVLRRCTP
jgi:hypothetical protein